MDILIRRATVADTIAIAGIGRVAVELSHRESCSVDDMNHFLAEHYNEEAIKAELANENNIYYLLLYKGQLAGFSKMVLNTSHPRIEHLNVTKLDRIYLLSEFYDKQLGRRLLQHNIDLSKQSGQCGMWLFTWQGNERAVNFYRRSGFEIIGNHRFKVSETHYNPHFQMMLRF